MFTSVCESGAGRKHLLLRPRCAWRLKASKVRRWASQGSSGSSLPCTADLGALLWLAQSACSVTVRAQTRSLTQELSCFDGAGFPHARLSLRRRSPEPRGNARCDAGARSPPPFFRARRRNLRLAARRERLRTERLVKCAWPWAVPGALNHGGRETQFERNFRELWDVLGAAGGLTGSSWWVSGSCSLSRVRLWRAIGAVRGSRLGWQQLE